MSVPYLCSCTYELTTSFQQALTTGDPYRWVLVKPNPQCTANHHEEEA